MDGGRDHAHSRRTSRAAPSSQQQQQQQPQQQPFVQAIAGQRLVIPCRNLSSSSSSFAQAEQSATNQSNRWQAALVLASSRFKTTQTAAASGGGGGGISLIVWHKDERLNAPIFAADARGAATLRDTKQQASSEALEGRAHLDLVALGERSAPAPALVIDEASLRDSGLYTCVVEFLRAPTQTFKTRVSVIEPPKNMIIRELEAGGDSNQEPQDQQRRGGGGQPATSTVSTLMGPYDEDSRVVLVCEAEPGKPTSGQVSWWRLDSVTQLGAQLGAGPGARKSSNQPVASLDAATHLTTLSVQENPTTTGRFWSDEPATPSSGPRDLFLGPQSLQLAPATTSLAFDPNQQLPAINHLMSALNLTPTTARLRHWRRVDNKTIATSDLSTGDTPTSPLAAHLELPALNRSMLGAEFLCLAANDVHSLAPLNTSVTLNMNLNPTEVRIINRSPPPPPAPPAQGGTNSNSNQSTLVLGQKTMVECQVVGSKPSPSIKWFRGAQEIEIVSSEARQVAGRSPATSGTLAASEFNRDTGNLTKISYLTFVPQLSDNQQALTCSASNTRIPQVGAGGRGALTDSLVMNVQHEPKLTLALGANIRPDSIKLGSDIFMDCQVEANPSIQELVWLHLGRPLAANISAGVIMSKQSLVLRNLALEQRGAYQCQARNLLGRATSDKLELRPLFEPQCDPALTRSRYEVALNQPTRIECHVRAEPAEGLHFTWRFNRSSSSLSSSLTSSELQPGGHLLDGAGDDATGSDSALSQYETNFTRSSVIFTPRSRRHFGTLLCSAANSMGRQARPCAIQLVQSELPEPVLLCFDDNIRPRSFSIHCTPPATTGGGSSSSSSSVATAGTGSGLGPNKYVLEVYVTSPEAAGQDYSTPPTPSSTHLRLRDQPARSSDADLTSASADYLAGGDASGDSTQADQEEPERQQKQQVRIKRLLSESPTFEVADLRPNSSYNVLVYVQNSKGRSPAFHHQVSTQPEEGAGGAIQAAASTHRGIELGAGGRAARGDDQAGAAANLLAYLKLDDYFGGKSRGGNGGSAGVARSPLVGVALVVLLASVSLVTLVFFAQRLICGRSGGGNKQQKRGCKSSKSSTATSGSDDDGSGQVLQREGAKQRRRPLASDSNEWHSRAAGGCIGLAGRGNGAGSGSDTSRETNTDSTTLVTSASPRPTRDELNAAAAAAQHQQAVVGSNYNNCQYAESGLVVVTAAEQQSSQGPVSNRRCSHSDLTTLAVETLACQNQAARAATMLRRPQQQQQQQQIPYDPAAHYAAAHQQLRNQAASCTPQMSMHSSECTSTSNNVDVNSLDHVRAGNYPPPDGGGVYVIQESAAPSDFWCDQLAMSMASDPRDHTHQGGRCQLVEQGQGGDHSPPCQSRGQQLPSSFSIPVALSDRLTLISGGARRPGSALREPLRLSQDNLALQAANCLINNHHHHHPNSPYLTLTSSARTPLYGDYCPYRQDEQQMPSPPVNFGGGCGEGGQGGWMAATHQQTDLDSLPAPMHQSNCATISRAPKHHRVKFDTAASSDFNELDTATSGPSSLAGTQQEPTRL